MSFNTATGALEGTPLAANATATAFTVTATNPAGHASTALSLRILEFPPRLSLPAALQSTQHLIRSQPAALPPPDNDATFFSSTLTFTSDPALPTGLDLNASTGAISGTPAASTAAAANYTITAANTGGNSSVILALRVHAHPTLAAAGTAHASPLCGPTTGATHAGAQLQPQTSRSSPLPPARSDPPPRRPPPPRTFGRHLGAGRCSSRRRTP